MDKFAKLVKLICFFCIILLILFFYRNGGFIFNSTVNEFLARKHFSIYFNGGKSFMMSGNLSSVLVSETSPSEIERLNWNVSYQGYMDRNHDRKCAIPNQHRIMFELLKSWIKIAAKHGIIWWINCGSLIGSLRHRDMVPWDHDIDIDIPFQFEKIIRNISTPRKEISSNKVNVISRPGPHCPYNGQRSDCRGYSVPIQLDVCAFCGPISRVFFDKSKFLDIFLSLYSIHDNQIKQTSEAFYEYTSKQPLYPIYWYFPLRKCSFMGLIVLCPRDSEKILNKFYGTFEMTKKCVDGKWINK